MTDESLFADLDVTCNRFSKLIQALEAKEEIDNINNSHIYLSLVDQHIDLPTAIFKHYELISDEHKQINKLRFASKTFMSNIKHSEERMGHLNINTLSEAISKSSQKLLFLRQKRNYKNSTTKFEKGKPQNKQLYRAEVSDFFNGYMEYMAQDLSHDKMGSTLLKYTQSLSNECVDCTLFPQTLRCYSEFINTYLFYHNTCMGHIHDLYAIIDFDRIDVSIQQLYNQELDASSSVGEFIVNNLKLKQDKSPEGKNTENYLHSVDAQNFELVPINTNRINTGVITYEPSSLHLTLEHRSTIPDQADDDIANYESVKSKLTRLELQLRDLSQLKADAVSEIESKRCEVDRLKNYKTDQSVKYEDKKQKYEAKSELVTNLKNSLELLNKEYNKKQSIVRLNQDKISELSQCISTWSEKEEELTRKYQTHEEIRLNQLNKVADITSMIENIKREVQSKQELVKVKEKEINQVLVDIDQLDASISMSQSNYQQFKMEMKNNQFLLNQLKSKNEELLNTYNSKKSMSIKQNKEITQVKTSITEIKEKIENLRDKTESMLLLLPFTHPLRNKNIFKC